MKGTILVVEDDREINRLLTDFLCENDYQVVSAFNGKEASVCFGQHEYDIVLMDLMLPYKNGSELIKEFRKTANVPVICISAKSGMETRLEVLRIGADDYIMKPFDLNEVLVRIEVVLRRAGKKNLEEKEQTKNNYLSCGNLVLDLDNNYASIKGNKLALTSKEFLILKLLMENPNKTFSKANLYESVWEDEYIYEDNTLNVHMSNLRNKLKKADPEAEYIRTVWGIGYCLAGF